MSARAGACSAAIALLAAGCASVEPARVRAGGPPRLGTVVLAAPDVAVRSVGLGSSRPDEEATGEARQRVRAAVEGVLREKGLVVLGPEVPWREEAGAQRALLLLAIEAGLAECRPAAAPACRETFDHGVGSLDGVLPPGADALLVVRGTDQLTTPGRAALSALLWPLEIVLEVAAAAGGAGGPLALWPAPSATHLTAALLDGEGTLLWWRALDGSSCCDLRDPAQAESSIRSLLEGIPSPGAAPAPPAAPDPG